jgi:hypothetical protein
MDRGAHLVLIIVAVLLRLPCGWVDFLHLELEHVGNLACCKAALGPRQDGEAVTDLNTGTAAAAATAAAVVRTAQWMVKQ